MKARACVFSCLIGVLLAPSISADEPILRARLRCERVPGLGRIVCELSVRAVLGKLVWSDALVVRAPLFARPLRSRIAAQLGASEGSTASAKFALVASQPGRGRLDLLVRGVVCRAAAAGGSCSPEVVTVSTLVEVDPPSAPAAAPLP
jgi:hypothetical protein